MARIFLGIGSNIDPHQHIPAGIESLRRVFSSVQVSPVYISPAYGFDGADFHNLVVSAETGQSVEAVIECLRELEFEHGRPQDAVKYSSRALDIDLLMYDDLVAEVCGYNIPRSDIYRFDFVLRPLSDLAPDQLHPICGTSFINLWNTMQHQQSGDAASIQLSAAV